jgi:hypothetical protein
MFWSATVQKVESKLRAIRSFDCDLPASDDPLPAVLSAFVAKDLSVDIVNDHGKLEGLVTQRISPDVMQAFRLNKEQLIEKILSIARLSFKSAVARTAYLDLPYKADKVARSSVMAMTFGDETTDQFIDKAVEELFGIKFTSRVSYSDLIPAGVGLFLIIAAGLYFVYKATVLDQ